MRVSEKLYLIAHELHGKATSQASGLLRFQLEQLAEAYEQVAVDQELQRGSEEIVTLGLQACFSGKSGSGLEQLASARQPTTDR